MVSLQYLGTAGVFEDPESGLSWERDGERHLVGDEIAARLTAWPHEHWSAIEVSTAPAPLFAKGSK